MKFMPPTTVKLADKDAERNRADHAAKIAELQKQPMVGAVLIADVSLPDGVATHVPHKLGKKPSFVTESSVRGAAAAGFIVENSRDAQYITLTASGYGATVTVDLQVVP